MSISEWYRIKSIGVYKKVHLTNRLIFKFLINFCITHHKIIKQVSSPFTKTLKYFILYHIEMWESTNELQRYWYKHQYFWFYTIPKFKKQQIVATSHDTSWMQNTIRFYKQLSFWKSKITSSKYLNVVWNIWWFIQYSCFITCILMIIVSPIIVDEICLYELSFWGLYQYLW